MPNRHPLVTDAFLVNLDYRIISETTFFKHSLMTIGSYPDFSLCFALFHLISPCFALSHK